MKLLMLTYFQANETNIKKTMMMREFRVENRMTGKWL